MTIGYDETEQTNEHDVSKTSVHQVYVIHSDSVLCVSFSIFLSHTHTLAVFFSVKKSTIVCMGNNNDAQLIHCWNEIFDEKKTRAPIV